MHVRHLGLQNFRNFAELALDLGPGLTLFHGGNAQGKTNLLEAVYMFATSKSVRAGNERETIGWDALKDEIPFARVRGDIERARGPLKVEIVVQVARNLGGQDADTDPEGGLLQKRVKINGVPRRASDLIGEVNVVLFTPQDIDLVYGSRSVRRRYLDMTLCQVDRALLRELQRYARVLAQRNSLLRAIKEGSASADELAFWDQELVEAGAFITARRAEAMAALDGLARAIHRDLTGGVEGLVLRYLPSVTPGVTEDAGRGAFREALEAIRQRETLQGVSLVGPHRDDFQFIVEGRDLGVYGSRGQQRTASLSLKLAEAKFMTERAGDRPILLLDDVFSELDAHRRGYLLSSIAEGGQALLTTAELERIDRQLLSDATMLEVAGGRVGRPAAW